jgi:hypothetical protein
MPILFKCELCRARLSISQKKAGKIGTCPKCGEAIHVPTLDEARDRQTESNSDKSRSSMSAADSLDSLPGDNSRVDVPRHRDSITDSTALDEVFDLSDDYIRVTERRSPSSGQVPEATQPTSSNSIDERAGHQRIAVARWIVYFQAGLIAVVAATFFIFGMMVGNLTSTGPTDATGQKNFRLTGSVLVEQGRQQKADMGSVVIALPAEKKPAERLDPEYLKPNRFEPVNNRAIDRIRDMGGDVVRANEDGSFELQLQGPAEFFILVISNAKSSQGEFAMEKSQRAEIGRFFLPYEPLLKDHEFDWQRINVKSDRDIKSIVF